MKNNRFKYPRTYHLPWSQGATNDDKILKDVSCFIGKDVVVTVKMDGENTTLYNDYIHARSIDYSPHESRAWVKSFWSQIQSDIPNGFRICGENLYAKHSIHYSDLETYFMGFSIWDGLKCLSWKETLEYFELLGIKSVPIIYEGQFNESLLKELNLDLNKNEGYVVRLADSFQYKDFNKSVAKFVRSNHVTSDRHWKHQKIEKNILKDINE
jgi:hypothetical protein